MAAGGEQTVLVRVAAVSAALTLIAIPASHLLGLMQIGPHELHDTYYISLNTDRIGVIAAISIAHQAGAIACAWMALTRPAAARAGWMLSVSATLLAASEFAAIAIFTFAPKPQRYVDFFSPAAVEPYFFDLARVYEVVLWVDLAAVLGMAAGWLLLAFARVRAGETGRQP